MSYETNGESSQPVQSVPFQYPNEETPTMVDDSRIRTLLDWLAFYVLVDSNPTLCLIAALYNAGYDVGGILGTKNTIRSISKEVGVVHVQLHKKVKQVQSELQLFPRINNGNKH